MPCPICGDICRCSTNVESAALPRWLPDIDSAVTAAHPGIEEPATKSPVLSSATETWATETCEAGKSQERAAEDSTAWREEVAERLNRYNSRRKPRPPRYPSLRLRFEDAGRVHAASGDSAESVAFPQSSNALALDEFAIRADDFPDPLTVTTSVPEGDALHATSPFFTTAEPQQAALIKPVTSAPTTAKIIEFPRSWTPAPPPIDELAEPVITRPRILEAPEVVPPPPALGGITIEPVQQSELEKRPGIDIPLQSAPLGRRVLSAVIDDVIIAAACFLFGFIFWKMTALRPPQFQIVGIAAGVAALFWAAYQYLLLVYSGTTPGLRLAHLELARFDGSRTGRRLRRWRVLASFLSAVSLGMGYAWVFLDEDALCWHDRITHTYLAQTK
jgi:uncharacterized RDD family membrane protein YckC